MECLKSIAASLLNYCESLSEDTKSSLPPQVNNGLIVTAQIDTDQQLSPRSGQWRHSVIKLSAFQNVGHD